MIESVAEILEPNQISSIIIYSKTLSTEHLALFLKKLGFIYEWNKADSLPRQSSPVQVDLKVIREILSEIFLCKFPILIGQ